jgi:nucleotide-binding universal stress UspA family protein
MKNIIVGIDFSPNSINALKHAIAISLKSGGALHLVWVKSPGTAKALDLDIKDNISHIAQAKLNELLKDCKAEAPKNEAHSIILEGKPANEMIKYASNLPDSMIVMGTHGISGFEEMFVGSNAFKVVSMSPIPVMVLREGIQINRDLTQILVPIDTSFETLQKMKYAIKFAKAFSAKILLLGLLSEQPETKHIVSVQLGHAMRMLEQANIRHDWTSLEIKGNITKAVVDFARDADVNLMIIMREEEQEFSDFWLGTTTRQILNTTPMPLLIIPNTTHFAITR